MLNVNTSLIRFWEKEFDILKPKKNKKGNRQFTKEDVLKNLNAFIKNNNFASNAMQNIDKLTQEDYINTNQELNPEIV